MNSAHLKPTENKYLLSTYHVTDTVNAAINGKHKIPDLLGAFNEGMRRGIKIFFFEGKKKAG